MRSPRSHQRMATFVMVARRLDRRAARKNQHDPLVLARRPRIRHYRLRVHGSDRLHGRRVRRERRRPLSRARRESGRAGADRDSPPRRREVRPLLPRYGGQRARMRSELSDRAIARPLRLAQHRRAHGCDRALESGATEWRRRHRLSEVPPVPRLSRREDARPRRRVLVLRLVPPPGPRRVRDMPRSSRVGTRRAAAPVSTTSR